MNFNSKLVLNKEYDIIIGGREHTCEYCVRAISEKEDITRYNAISKLKGNFTGEPLLRVSRKNGDDIVICKTCLKNINKLMESYNK